jgi:hypothetical protein
VEYFNEKNGRYFSRKLSAGIGNSQVIRVVISLIPVFVMAGVYILALKDGAKSGDLIPIIIGASLFLFASILSFILRRSGFGAGIIVDQMQGTVSCRLPGGQKHVVPIASVKEIGLQHAESSNPGTTFGTGTAKAHGLLFLVTQDDRKFPVMYGSNAMEMRQLADELSVLISVTVNEYSRGQFQ